MTGPTVLQQKIVERFSHLGRVEAVMLQHKSVVSILLNRVVWLLISSYVAVHVILYHFLKHMSWQLLPRVRILVYALVVWKLQVYAFTDLLCDLYGDWIKLDLVNWLLPFLFSVIYYVSTRGARFMSRKVRFNLISSQIEVGRVALFEYQKLLFLPELSCSDLCRSCMSYFCGSIYGNLWLEKTWKFHPVN